MNTYYLLSSTDTNTLIEQIIKFNATLPKNKRIHLQSFDIDYGIHPTLLALKILIIKNKAENNQPWQQLLSFIQEAEKKFTLNPKDKNDKIIHNGYYELKKINSWIDTSLNFIKSDTLYYQKKFKHDFVKLSQLLKSLKDGLVFNFKDYAYREKILTQNIYDLLKNKNQKYMFTTGVAHVMNGFPGAFYLINRDLPPEKMLISICLYNKKQYKKEWKDMGYASSMIKEMKSSLKKNKTNIFKNKFNQRIYSNDSPDADFTFILPVK